MSTADVTMADVTSTTATDSKPVVGSSSTSIATLNDHTTHDTATTTTTTTDDTHTSSTNTLPDDANQVLYINNLNERIKPDVMKGTLKNLFREYGKVWGVTAHNNIRMRGQAFVTLESTNAAVKAVKEVQKFPLYGKPMQLTFAKTKSDALVQKLSPEHMSTHKQARLEQKKMSRKGNPLRRKWLAQKIAAKKAAEAAGVSIQDNANSGTGAATNTQAAANASRRIVQMPDEYLPPNKILFVQNLPDDTTKEKLEAVFRPYAGLSEVRTIPGRRNIAFVEFVDETTSGVARDALHNTKFGQGDNALKLKVTFAKKG
ncbi:hypothetical protein OIO90_001051 [Microbotryomycetes sp. JL221]|nr:hypothetical protein OIO90_001051 [Microbotryomycetes sp. JL221]